MIKAKKSKLNASTAIPILETDVTRDQAFASCHGDSAVSGEQATLFPGWPEQAVGNYSAFGDCTDLGELLHL